MKSFSQTKLPNGAVAVRRQSTPGVAINTKHLLNTGRGPQNSRKANQTPQTEVGQKIKTKKGRQRSLGLGPEPGEGVVKQEVFSH